MMTNRSGPERLTDDELKAHLRKATACERAALVEWLRHLGEMDRRRAYVADGCSSLFAWCRTVLWLSEAAAHVRIRNARAMRRFPAIGERLASGDIHLDAVARLAPHLTADNHLALLDEARRAPREVIDAIVARFQPPGTKRARIVARRVSVAAATVRVAGGPAAGGRPIDEPTAPHGGSGGSPAVTLPLAMAIEPGDTVTETVVAGLDGPAPPPLDYRVHVTISARAHDDLERLRELMRHQVPDGDPAAILELALARLRRQVEKSALGMVERPRASRAAGPSTGRHVPMAVRRAVRERDGDRCAFRSGGGRRCDARAWLEFHHVVPHARGGPVTSGNIELRCRAHNRYEAEREFDGFVREGSRGYVACGGGSTGGVVSHSWAPVPGNRRKSASRRRRHRLAGFTNGGAPVAIHYSRAG
jgi:hypothetical protein